MASEQLESKGEKDAKTEEMEQLAKILYNQVFVKYGFESPFPELTVLKKSSKENIENETDSQEKENKDYKYIFKAMLVSQTFLRDFCQVFKVFDEALGHSYEFFRMTIIVFIRVWMGRRENVFHKTIDSLAIVAEFFLFYKSSTDGAWPLSLAPSIFTYVFENLLKEEFFSKGGIVELQRLALEDYDPLYLVLEQYFCTVNKYERLKYNCNLIRSMRMSPVMFPVYKHFVCVNCSGPLPDVLYECAFYPKSFLKWQTTLSDNDSLLTKDKVKELDSKWLFDTITAPDEESPVNLHFFFLGGIKLEKKTYKIVRCTRIRT